MHEPDLPEKDHRIDPDDQSSPGSIFLAIIKFIAIGIGIVIFLVVLGLFALYLVCAFDRGRFF